MPKYGRKKFSAKRKAGMRKPRSYSRKKYKKRDKLVSLKMLRNVVPKPELKRFETINVVPIVTTNAWQQLATFGTAFDIPQGDQRWAREGQEIHIRYIQCKVELNIDSASVSTIQLAGGTSLFGNTFAALHNDQELRVVCIDDTIDSATGAGVSQFPKAPGSSTFSNARGGASEYWYDLDTKFLKTAGRTVHFDKKLVLSKAVAVGSNPVAPATLLGPIGMPKPTPDTKMFTLTIKYPGVGKRITFHDGVAVPTYRPVLWFVGKNAAAGNNPVLRMHSTRVWFTDV